MELTRRFFFKWLGAAAASVALLPRIAYAKVKKVGIPLAKAPALQKVDGSVILKVKDRDILFVRTGEQEISAVSSVCSHQKCQVGYNALVRKIECSCHGSKFSTDGKVLKGPALQDLTGYRATLAGDQIVLEIDE